MSAPIVVSFDDGRSTYPARAILPGDWNGFARPLFVLNVADQIARDVRAIDRSYGEARDDDEYAPAIVEHDGETLGAIGLDAWCWAIVEHAEYPHHAGMLYDCPACDAACHCEPGSSECVFDGAHNGSAS